VRVGNISQGKTQCDACKKNVPYAERYLMVKEKKGAESDDPGAEMHHYCVKCAVEKGYVDTRVEKGEKITTFFKGKVTAPAVTEDIIADAMPDMPAEIEAEKEE